VADPTTHGSGERELLDDRLIRALGHPLRHRILEILNQRTASASDLARELDAELGVVAYHVNKLLEWDLVEVAGTDYGRGGLRRVYRAIQRAMLTNEQAAALPLSVWRGITGGVLRQIWRDVAAASETGGFDAPDTHVSWTPLDLDDEGYADVVAVADAALERILAIQAEVIERRARGTASGEARTELVILHFARGKPAPSAEAPAEPAPPSREEVYTLTEEIADEVAAAAPDWSHVSSLLSALRGSIGPQAAG
jgi:DNA-binding transcriptional ArsR family regulator